MNDEPDVTQTDTRQGIQELYRRRSIVPSPDPAQFGCEYYPDCSDNGKRALYTGNWAYVGEDYGVGTVAGQPVKPLFVGMDRGGYPTPTKETFPDTQSVFRRAIEHPQNPHMGGVSLVLEQLLDECDLAIISRRCAVTNALKCARRTKSATTKPRRNMIANCRAHLEAETAVLEPDIIITHGKHPGRSVSSLYPTLQTLQRYSRGNRRARLCRVPNGPLILVLPHPSRQGGLSRKRRELPQFWQAAINDLRALYYRE